MFNRIKKKFKSIFSTRLLTMILVFGILFFILIYRVFTLQIVRGKKYMEDYKLLIQKTKESKGTRGKIFDRNGNVLADNKLAYSVTIEDDGSFDAETRTQKNKVINDTIIKAIHMIEKNNDHIYMDFGITLDENGKFAYVHQPGTLRQRFIADVYGKRTIDALSKEQAAAAPENLIHFLCTNPQTGYGIVEKKYSSNELLKLVAIRYQMSLNSYQKYIPVTIAEDVNDKTVAAIEENKDTLYGIDVTEDSLRTYPDAKYFAPLLGYTGKISKAEYDSMKNIKDTEYSLTDVVGKSGLEKSMDPYLQGAKGKEVVFVDNVGKVVESQKKKASKAGNNLYLTVDKNLTMQAYNIVEQKLAGILLSKIQNVTNYTPDPEGDSKNVIIPIDDVYYALISNNVLDSHHFSTKDAKGTEQLIYKIHENRLGARLEEVIAQLENPKAPAYKDLGSKEMEAYMNYIAMEYLTYGTQIIRTDKIDTSDPIYLAWKKEESINLYTYLNHAISKNWVDTGKLHDFLPQKTAYTDAEEVYQAIIKYLKEDLKTDTGFSKLVYRYLIKEERITGNQLCLALFEQDVLKHDENAIRQLSAGGSAYDFIRSKIQSLELTPGMLGLEPCTGSAVVTDPNSGQVLALVSYPGYDNNRLANHMDTSYYYKLQTSNARPFYNKATQERTAPGSTYKMVSSVAGLTEGVINAHTGIHCSGIFEKISPHPKCWIYPGAHGTLNVVDAIRVSCNDYFYEVGYRLGQSAPSNAGSKYSSEMGINRLKKYAKAFGLGSNTGIEIPESSPQISNTDSVRSAIGQGTNNYTVSQLARYVQTVANEGNLKDLTLLLKLTNPAGKTIKEYSAKQRDAMKHVSSQTWTLVHSGMTAVIQNSEAFSSLSSKGFQVAGKTGTAQQSNTHGDHALFVGYAPANQPTMAIAVRIANGYFSSYAAEIGRDIISSYFHVGEESINDKQQAAQVGPGVARD